MGKKASRFVCLGYSLSGMSSLFVKMGCELKGCQALMKGCQALTKSPWTSWASGSVVSERNSLWSQEMPWVASSYQHKNYTSLKYEGNFTSQVSTLAKKKQCPVWRCCILLDVRCPVPCFWLSSAAYYLSSIHVFQVVESVWWWDLKTHLYEKKTITP